MTIGSKASGASRPGTSSWAVQGGTARITTSSGPRGVTSSPKARPVARPPEVSSRFSRRWNASSAPRPCSQATAGSTKAAARVGLAMRGRQARPPSARVSRTTAAANSSEARSGGVLRTASRNGSSRRSQSGPRPGRTSPIVRPSRPRSSFSSGRWSTARVPGVRRRGSRIHQGRAPSFSRSVHRSPDLASAKAMAASSGPSSRSRAPMVRR